MDCSIPGFPVLHYLLEFAKTQVHWVGDANQPSHVLSPPSPSQSFPEPGYFSKSRLFTSGGQSIGASASVFPMNIQYWFPLGLTVLISLLSKGLSRVFSSTTTWKHQFFCAQPSLFNLGLEGFPSGTGGKESAYQYRRWKRCHFNTWAWKISWSREKQPTQENTMDRGALQATVHGNTESDMTE